MKPRSNALTSACALTAAGLLACSLGACASSGSATANPPASRGASTLPAPADRLGQLRFMTGQWACVNPNKSVNREHWMSPAGSTMLGMFQQMRADGAPTLYELTAIVQDKDAVTLYNRHLHRKLDIDDRRKDADIFVLREVSEGLAVFAPLVDQPGGIETMTYRAQGPDTLIQELVFKPDSKEKNFSSVYSRE